MDRRKFIQQSAVAGAGLMSGISLRANAQVSRGLRLGMIGLDTSHCVAFTKSFNAENAGQELGGFKVVAAFPTSGSSDLPASIDRIAGFTQQMRDLGVEIVESIEDLVMKSDFIFDSSSSCETLRTVRTKPKIRMPPMRRKAKK